MRQISIVGVILLVGACSSAPTYESQGMRECYTLERIKPGMLGECVQQVHERRMQFMRMNPEQTRALLNGARS